MRRERRSKIAVIVALAALAGAAAAAQDRKPPTQLRTVRGMVLDEEEKRAPSAVVYLKNLRTRTVRTYIAEGTGEYRFSGLDPNVDYEIHAKSGKFSSAKRTISNLDSRKEFVIDLKLKKQTDK